MNWRAGGQQSEHDSRPRLNVWFWRRGRGRKRSNNEQRRRELRP